jgi:DNA mismatch repair protein MutL
LFLSQIQNSKGISQQILFPEELELSDDDTLFFEQIIPDLRNAGFEFEQMGKNTFYVKGVSSLVSTSSVIDLLLVMIDNTKTTALDPTNSLQESISLSLAKSTALKAGQRLTNEEMCDLIDRLFACSNHNFTPDGKLIMTIIAHDEIEKRF